MDGEGIQRDPPSCRSLSVLLPCKYGAIKHLPTEQLALTPKCGFGGVDHLVIPEEDQWNVRMRR